MSDADELLATASCDQVVAYENEDGSNLVLEAVGVDANGSGGLNWVPSSFDAVVRNKYRMMCAMLKDNVRNRRYAQAIERKVREHLISTGQPPLVLDIGTGSGFLGMVAARAGANVLACEMNEAIADMARTVVARNGLQSRIKICSVRSDELTRDMLNEGRGADLILTETMDSELLSEGMVPTLRHACGELLSCEDEEAAANARCDSSGNSHRGSSSDAGSRVGSRVVPRCAQVFAELVEINSAVAPCLGQLNTSAVLKWGALEQHSESGASADGGCGGGNGRDIVEPATIVPSAAVLHAPLDCGDWPTGGEAAAPVLVQADHLRRTGAIRALCDPVLVHTVDFSALGLLPERLEVEHDAVATSGGRCDGVLIWWQAECDEAHAEAEQSNSDDLKVGTAPGSPFQDHWHSALHPVGRSVPETIAAGGKAQIRVRCNDVRLAVEAVVAQQAQPEQQLPGATAAPPPHECLQPQHLPLPSKRPRAARPPRLDARLAYAPAEGENDAGVAIERTWELADVERTRRYALAIAAALRSLEEPRRQQPRPSPVMCVDVCDSSLCACIAMGVATSATDGAAGTSRVVLSLEKGGSSPPVPCRMWRAFAERLVAHIGQDRNALDTALRVVQAACHETDVVRAALDASCRHGQDDEGGGSVIGEAGSREATDHLNSKSVSLIMAEPYYSCCAGRQTLCALNFWYQVRSLRPLTAKVTSAAVRGHSESVGCLCVPSRARVRAVAVHFGELASAHGELGSSPCGLDHAPLDALWHGCPSRLHPYPLWQYAHEVVSSAPATLLTLDFEHLASACDDDEQSSTPPSLPDRTSAVLELAKDAPAANAIALYVEWCLPTRREHDAVLEKGAVENEGDAEGRGAMEDAEATDGGACLQRQPYSRHEVAFLPRELLGKGASRSTRIEFEVVIEGGALRLDFGEK